ncbi:MULTISPECIES: winged helix-turn-helix domain-containing protein [unclassified Mesorhizobium]|uniref:winged helix-turn-helix domain-containing protein n=2 Tax=Mesorhizobium TaxID=68287 RepID=UPI0016790657|nr:MULTISPECIES: winged helix-turn-helix domain-containing protein [unclassified Mesorhizobium]
MPAFVLKKLNGSRHGSARREPKVTSSMPTRFAINGVVADLSSETLLDKSGNALALRPQSFAVLRYFLMNPNRLVTKDELMKAVWHEVAVTDDSLVQCVRDIRSALRDDRQSVLQTVPKRGYRFVLPPQTASGRSRAARPTLIAAAVVGLVAAGAIVWRINWPAATRGNLSIAVLPFDDFSGSGQQSRLADALTDDIITELARIRYVKVIARNSVDAYKGKSVDVRQIAHDLGTTYVLEGSLEMRETQMRVTAQLIDAEGGTHLWSERYDRKADDFFIVRDDVVTRLVGTLTGYDGPLWAQWTQSAKRRTPGSLQAFDYFLLAKEPYRRHHEDGNLEARHLIEKAIDLDPQFAAAWNYLANTYMQDAINGWNGDRAGSWQNYRDAVQKAASLDPQDGSIQESLGVMYFERGEVQLGRQAWERALQLAPNDNLVNRAIGAQLPLALGTEHAADGVKLVERALNELDPLHPPFQEVNLGIALYFAGRYPEAADALGKVPEPWLEPRLMLALSFAQAGVADKAKAQAAEVMKLDPDFSAEAWIANDIYQPGSSSAVLFVEGARKAGLPICARDVARIEPKDRLPECEAGRGKG